MIPTSCQGFEGLHLKLTCLQLKIAFGRSSFHDVVFAKKTLSLGPVQCSSLPLVLTPSLQIAAEAGACQSRQYFPLLKSVNSMTFH
jgi:hypothetical protein